MILLFLDCVNSELVRFSSVWFDFETILYVWINIVFYVCDCINIKYWFDKYNVIYWFEKNHSVSFGFKNDFVNLWVDIKYCICIKWIWMICLIGYILSRLKLIHENDFIGFKLSKWFCLLRIGNNKCWIDCMYLCYHSVEHDFCLFQIGIKIWLLLAWAICFVLI